jgi:hypothetical protein
VRVCVCVLVFVCVCVCVFVFVSVCVFVFVDTHSSRTTQPSGTLLRAVASAHAAHVAGLETTQPLLGLAPADLAVPHAGQVRVAVWLCA